MYQWQINMQVCENGVQTPYWVLQAKLFFSQILRPNSKILNYTIVAMMFFEYSTKNEEIYPRNN